MTNRRHQAARTLAMTSGLLMLGGAAMGSPAGMLFCSGVAGLLALGAVPLGTRRAQIVALFLLAAAVGLVAAAYPGYRQDLQRIRAMQQQ